MAEAVRLLAPELQRLGWRSEALTGDDPGAAWLATETGVAVHAAGPSRSSWCWSARLQPWLREHETRFDAVVVHGLWQWPSLAARRERRDRLFAMPHGMLDPYFQQAPERRLKAIRNWIYWKLVERRLIESAESVLFTCEEEMRLAATAFRPYRPRRTTVVGLGVKEPPPFSPSMREAFRAAVPALGDRPYLLFLGRIHPKKGVDLLLAAIGETPLDVVIAGPCANKSYLERLHAAAGVRRGRSVHFVDMLSGDAKWGALYGCEAFILPSHQENFGIAVVEAMACGRPVLISNRVNIWREVEETGAGLVDEDNIPGTTRLLRRFHSHSSAKAMGAAAREAYQSHFLSASAARRLADVLNESCLLRTHT